MGGAIEKNTVSFVGIAIAVTQRELKRTRVPAPEQVHLPSGLHASGQSQVLLLADGEVNLDRIDLRNSRKGRRLANQIANLRHRPPGDPGDERADLRESQVELSLFHVGFSDANPGALSGLLLYFVVELALSYGMRLGEGRIALYVDVGQGKLRSRLRQLTLRLIQRCLKRPGINLEQDLPALYDGPFAVILFVHLTGYLSLNLRIAKS